MGKYVVIDFQWYRFNGKSVIPKELAICDSDRRISHFVFRPFISFGCLSVKDREVARYLFNKYHSLMWEDGFISLNSFDDIVKRFCYEADVVYVKGYEKVQFLKTIINNKNVIDVKEAGRILPGKPSCMFHRSDYCVCALTNVQRLYEFLMNNVSVR